MNSFDLTKLYSPAEAFQRFSMELHGKYEQEKALLWFVEEVGELIASIRKGKSKAEVFGEFSDVLVWVVCLSNILDIDLSAAFRAGALKEAKRQIAHYGRYKYASVDFTIENLAGTPTASA
jgi:NTP pyrophosphatase (non-canonical NTP hydrolase)